MNDLLTALKALAEPTRLRLLNLCAQAELTVSELTLLLGQSQPRISRHLKLLYQAGILDRHREGSWVYFQLASKGIGRKLARVLVSLIPEKNPTVKLDSARLQALLEERAQKATEYFNNNATNWNLVRSLHVEDKDVEARLLELLPDGDPQSLLDLGTGTGRLLELFSPLIPSLVGVDSSSEMLKVARSNLEIQGIRNCTLRQGDVRQLRFQSDFFDVVTVHQVLHFMENPEEVVGEATRVLKSTGCLIVVDFEEHGMETLREEHSHRWLGFRAETIRGWMNKAGLTKIDHYALAGGELTVGIWVGQTIKPEAPSDE
jgi:ArsR family transcriptional regulator